MVFICWQKYNLYLGGGIYFLIVPEEFMYNPLTRSYGEPHKRPEVQNSTVEFIASSDYMVKKVFMVASTAIAY